MRSPINCLSPEMLVAALCDWSSWLRSTCKRKLKFQLGAITFAKVHNCQDGAAACLSQLIDRHAGIQASVTRAAVPYPQPSWVLGLWWWKELIVVVPGQRRFWKSRHRHPQSDIATCSYCCFTEFTGENWRRGFFRCNMVLDDFGPLGRDAGTGSRDFTHLDFLNTSTLYWLYFLCGNWLGCQDELQLLKASSKRLH